MADVKISQLPAATTPLAGTEQIPLVQSSTTKQITVSNLLTAANLGTPTAINLTNATNVPVDEATGILPVANGGNGTATPSLVGGTNITVSGSWPNQTITATGSAAGDVTGPSSSTDNAVARFDNTTGKVIQNSGVIINDSGEITTGAWKGSEVTVPYGGTGASTLSGILKGNGQSAIGSAVAGTDYVAPGGALGTPSSGTATNLTGLPLTTGVTGTLPVANGGTGTTTPSLVAGTNVTITGTWPNQTIAATGGGGGGGSVTDVSVVSANGLAGTVATSTTTPAITLSTTVTGVVKGNGTALSAATAGTDYVAPGGALGTPSSGTLTNTTGLPLSTGVTGTLPIANGGSGQTTAQTAMNAFAGATTSGSYLRGNGTNVVMSTIQAADVPTLNQNTTGTAAGLSATLAIGSGGTGQTTAATAITALTGTQVSGQYLRSNGTSAALSAIQAADVPTLNQNTTGSAGSVTNALTAGTGISFSSGTTYNGSAAITINSTGVASYPGAGIPNSTGSAWGTSYSVSGSGTTVALTTSPTFVTPVLGTPTSATLTNATGLPIATGVSGLGTGVATALAVNVGSAGAPVVNGGALGTPSSGTLTNATGLPISTGVSGLGTGVATFLTTPSSANLIAAVSDETGSGSLVFNTAPAITNPTVTNYVETPYSANSSTAITLALTNGTVQIITLTGNATITMPTATSGKSFILLLKQDATGSRTVTWSTVVWPGGTAPTITATASKQDIYSFFADGTNWYGVNVGQNYTP